MTKKKFIFPKIILILFCVIGFIVIANICVDTISKYIIQKEYQKEYDNNYIIDESNYDYVLHNYDFHKFDYGSYLQDGAKFVHFEEWETNALGPPIDYAKKHPEYVGPPTKIIYKNPDGTYFAIEYCRYIPNEVTIYEKFTKDDIRIEKIITKKAACGHYHSNFEGVRSNDDKVWSLNNIEKITIKY